MSELSIHQRAVRWMVSGDKGLSSETLWAALMGGEQGPNWTPSDSHDFGRCYRLLKLIPEWRARLGDVPKVLPDWKQLVAAWPECEALWEAAGCKWSNALDRRLSALTRGSFK